MFNNMNVFFKKCLNMKYSGKKIVHPGSLFRQNFFDIGNEVSASQSFICSFSLSFVESLTTTNSEPGAVQGERDTKLNGFILILKELMVYMEKTYK